MKEHTQTTGIRKWAGDDLIELQKEPLDALQALVEPYAPCIIQGCVPSPNENGEKYTVSPGFVALKGKLTKEGEEERTEVKIVRFEGKIDTFLPLYLGLNCKPENRAYADGGNKPIKNVYVAEELGEDTGDGFCLVITANDSANPHLVDTMGITQKLDREGGDASNIKVVSFQSDTATDHINIGANSTLKELFGKIWRWFNDLKAMAFKEKVEKDDFNDDLKIAFDNKVDKINGKGLSEANFTKEEKKKLNDIDEGANNYTLPQASPSVLGGIKTNHTTLAQDYKVSIDNSGNAYVNVPWTDTTYTVATQKGDGLMPKDDKKKLDAIAEGANNYTHPSYTARTGSPTANQKPGFGGTFSVSQVTSDVSGHISGMTTRTVTIPNAEATTSAAGLMSAANKTKLDGIAEGANNYTLPQATSSVLGGIKLTSDSYAVFPDNRVKIPVKGSADTPVVIANEILDCSTKNLGTKGSITVYPGMTALINANKSTVTIYSATSLQMRTGNVAYLYQANVTDLQFYWGSKIVQVLASAAAMSQSINKSTSNMTVSQAMGMWSIVWLDLDKIYFDFIKLGTGGSIK